MGLPIGGGIQPRHHSIVTPSPGCPSTLPRLPGTSPSSRRSIATFSSPREYRSYAQSIAVLVNRQPISSSVEQEFHHRCPVIPSRAHQHRDHVLVSRVDVDTVPM